MFLQAYDDHADAIYRHLYFRVFSRARAEEMTQEVFMKTWIYISEGRQVENIRAFLYQVARNLLADESRRKKEDSLDALMESGWEAGSEEHLLLERRALGREIVSALGKLPPQTREVVTMRYIEDMDPREMAEVLGITPNAVSVRLNRALKELRNIFTNQHA